LGEQVEQARSVPGADVGADRGEVQFVGCGQLGEVPALLYARNESGAGEPVDEQPIFIGQAAIAGFAVAGGVEVRQLLGVGSDCLRQIGAVFRCAIWPTSPTWQTCGTPRPPDTSKQRSPPHHDRRRH
jgi:hypothetical protein